MRLIFITCIVGLLFANNASADKPMRFKAQLEGFNLTGAPVATAATGQARGEVIDDGSALSFRVNVENFDNLLMAHIHVADGPVMVTDFSGPPVYWFNGGPPPGDTLAETIRPVRRPGRSRPDSRCRPRPEPLPATACRLRPGPRFNAAC